LSFGNPRRSFVGAVLVQGCHQEYTIRPFVGHLSVDLDLETRMSLDEM
jgi:hypothetical protein